MLAKEADRRYHSVKEIRIDLLELIEASGPTGSIPSRTEKKPVPSVAWLGLAVLTVFLLVLVLWKGDFLGPSQPSLEAEENSIAVLPLQQLGGDPEKQYFQRRTDRGDHHPAEQDQAAEGHLQHLLRALQGQ